MKSYSDTKAANVNGFHAVSEQSQPAFNLADYAGQQARIAAKRAVRLSVLASGRAIADRADEVVNAALRAMGINA